MPSKGLVAVISLLSIALSATLFLHLRGNLVPAQLQFSLGSARWEPCGEALAQSTSVTVTTVSLIPNAPTRGQTVTVNVEGNLNTGTEVTDGQIQASVFYMGFKVRLH